ncbi:MAG: hypothetical protein AB1679_36085 [Actinomycetota bacterium]
MPFLDEHFDDGSVVVVVDDFPFFLPAFGAVSSVVAAGETAAIDRL